MFPEKIELAFEIFKSAFRRRFVVEVSDSPDNPPSASSRRIPRYRLLVGDDAQMRMKKIDDLFVGPLKKRPVVDCGIGDEPEVGPRLHATSSMICAVMSRFMCQRVLIPCCLFSWRKIANRMRSIEVRSWKAPMGRVLRRTSRNRRSIALVVLTCLR